MVRRVISVRRRDVAALAGGLFMLALSHSAHAAPADRGAWSPVYQLPVVPIHAHVLSDGNVLFWQDDDVSLSQPSTNYSKAYVVSIPAGSAPGAPTYYPNSQTNLFCAGHAMLPDGRLLAIGGQEKDYYIGVLYGDLLPYRRRLPMGDTYQLSYARPQMVPKCYYACDRRDPCSRWNEDLTQAIEI